MRINKRVRQWLWISGALSICMHTFAGAGTLINGAGATFPYPLYSKWFSDFRKLEKDFEINYQSIGSGGGIRQLLDKTVDFGASDAPMTDEQLAKSEVPIIHIPTVLGAVVLTFNIKDIKNLNLNQEVLSGIFLGKITQWSDPKIAKINPGVALPNIPIVVIHRSDGSGTSAIFTDYLAKISPEWKTNVGSGTAVKWPVGLGGKGNEGVTGLVKQTPGAIGYVELIYAKSNGLPVAMVRNQAGQFVEPNMQTVSAAAAGSMKLIPEDFRVSITNATGKTSYPISGFTYLLLYTKMDAQKGKVLKKFVNWAVTEGQKSAAALHYAPLPKELIAKVKKTSDRIQ